MRKGEPRFNVFERIESLKVILEPIVPDKDSQIIRGLMLKCVQYQLGRNKELSQDQAKALELVLKNNIHPKRAYEWLLLEDVPRHIKEKLMNNKISFYDARAQYVQWKRMSGTRAGKDIMTEMRSCIRRLKWKSQEETHMV